MKRWTDFTTFLLCNLNLIQQKSIFSLFPKFCVNVKVVQFKSIFSSSIKNDI